MVFSPWLTMTGGSLSLWLSGELRLALVLVVGLALLKYFSMHVFLSRGASKIP